ncbi:hypothetical protein DQ04_03721040 [Trypanosoma grayi]|uniref:hypothetical protein n=1 Tax=Trypanosoma grayi TaxID=71804 RepID=UPI0004F4BBC9|nr:hypothetical protein DQ04_03721040 [Trypanosoma grayi]KEG10431.1 hypothetical protein DQ04_03721040 [Trypanosoma grayi]
MRSAKKSRLVSSCHDDNNNNSGNNNVPQSIDVSSCGSSDGGSPRRRLELDDEGSQSLSFDPNKVAAIGVGDVHYDPGDHTVAMPLGRPSSHMMVLPRILLGGAEASGSDKEDHGVHAGCTAVSEMDWQRSPSAGLTSAAAVGASPDSAVRMPAVSQRAVPPLTSATALRPGCAFIRLPHPRHGEPGLFLCPPATDSAPSNHNDGNSNDGGGDSIAEATTVVLYEVQAQAPPGGFGQTWLIDEAVEPNEDLLVVTPFDVTFFVLRQAATHAMKDKFVSAEDLIMGASRGGGGGRGAEWPGWGVAVAQCPALAPAVAMMQSHAVLARICEFKSVGGDQYYRFSEDKVGAWLRKKVQQVASCPALRDLLQLGTETATTNGDGDGAPNTVPLPVAFGVVAEYVVEEVAAKAAQLCGAADAGS